ncbi:MAG TPA: hypothetical protein VIH79_02655 [Candidatus Nanopelagicaceae bacterium]
MTFPGMKSIVVIAIALFAFSTVQSQAATAATTPNPSVSGAPRSGGFGGGQNSSAFAKYTACLTKAGIKLPAFGGFGGRHTRPSGAPTARSTPRPRQSVALTPSQQKAFTACAALRPTFNGFGGKTPAPKTPTTKKSKIGTSAAYIACLNKHGLPVQTASEIAGLDSQNTKVIAAEKACLGK